MTTGETAAILSMSGQALLFFFTVLMGAGIGLFFDVFRILRKTVPVLAKSSIAVQLEDLFFWLVVTGGMFYFMLHYNFGEIRLFAILGAACGLALYFAILSRLVITVCVSVINYLKKVVAAAFRIIFAPLRLLINAVSPPAKKLHGKVRSGLCRLLRYGKIRLKKTSRNWFILRKKV
ncbi:MAG: spore cortex biosynthesis protein YabQ [Defluviitaleaceae bacterium]|nr:spore cortex biosynthesis protein YabQ [Defluviitaleaceae bacterium]MCL2263157.1 spore cortex biosynthesis protein YabQ [Defluviitaleaceae bacterium]